MKQAPLSVLQLSVNNLKRRPFRMACLVIVVAILAFSLFGGSILTLSLKNGMNSMQQRLGADLMVVPEGHGGDVKGILLNGTPDYFYFNQSVVHQVSEVNGVSQVTAQLFLASLSKSCCSEPVQLIAFDPDTDFVIQPWIAQSYGGTIGDGQLIVGSDIVLESNHTLRFFNHVYPVVAQLDKTATGLDSSVFMNTNTMKTMVVNARLVEANFSGDKAPEGAVSSVLVDIDAGYDADTVADTINSRVPGVDVVVQKDMISGTSNNLGSLVSYVYLLSAALLALVVIVLAVVFSVTINERKKEFAVLRIIGATRKKLIAVVLTESLIVSVAGSLIGTIAASLLVFPFSTYIGDKLHLPYLLPTAWATLAALGLCLFITFTVGPLVSIFSAFKISKAETYFTMREGE
jgi:putative ABC transport system permease protein